jgi:pimeloyl-ACP methyl ester carboxylesterase
MNHLQQKLARSGDVQQKVALLFRERMRNAQRRFTHSMYSAWAEHRPTAESFSPIEAWQQWFDYSIDFVQRTILFWDTLRQRGNDFVAYQRAGFPPVLHFDYELVMDGRSFEKPVNYALVRIVPLPGATVDSKRRPYVIIDPRAGHGPGIGGFKDDSQVGVALRDGHPVYFVIFFPEPEPGQSVLDVCAAEARFVHKVHELHPESAKPAVVGNCQGGWAAMMLAASHPDDTGAIVISGAPMSYWGGAWRDGEGDNPMRYAGGLLGGTWLASLASDLGNGKFDGAYLVQNFENLNPANSLWKKYYQLFANIDTEPQRFLDFERWWGGYFLLGREEIEWITKNLFVGNKLGSDADGSRAFDLREIESPIILFASMGNITPPQQAFNWIADVYGSTEEIKARGQVIVGLLHPDTGHLGIFVSGKVAKREHAQIVSVLKSIGVLRPGLYGMRIAEASEPNAPTEYEVEFIEHRLEDVGQRLNRFQRIDEKPFEAVAAVAELNQSAYELFARPFVTAVANEPMAEFSRAFHPLRFQRWAFSDLNPWLGWLGPAAVRVKSQRQRVAADQPYRRAERLASETVSAWLDWYRDVRDATCEAAFFHIYGNMFAFILADRRQQRAELRSADPRELPFVKTALAAIAKGGYAEAFWRVLALIALRHKPVPLAALELGAELASDYRDLLPELEHSNVRRGEQELIVQYARDQAIETLPVLLRQPQDRERLLTLLERFMSDKRVQAAKLSEQQVSAVERIRTVLGAEQVVETRGLAAPRSMRRSVAKRA